MTFAVGLSEHPSPPEAMGEVIGAVLDRLGPSPDLAVLFLSPSLAGAAEDLAATVRSTLAPGVLVGATATTIIGGGREVEQGHAVALWAANVGPCRAIRLETEVVEGGVRIRGVPAPDAQGGPRTLVLLGDPYSLPLEALLAGMADDQPDLSIVGGMASGARGPGGNRLVLDDQVHRDGAVGVLLPPGATAHPLVSQGCRPVGEPMIVTRVDGPVLLELAGQPAIDQLLAVGRGLDDEDRAVFESGPQVGIVVDEGQPAFSTGDFLIRGIVGADPDRRGVAIGDRVAVGTTVQFHLRDAVSADEELRRLLSQADQEVPAGRDRGALVFTCNGRGSTFFGRPDHDAELVSDLVGSAVAGMACAGEIGPIGDRSHLHGFTASVLLLRDRP